MSLVEGRGEVEGDRGPLLPEIEEGRLLAAFEPLVARGFAGESSWRRIGRASNNGSVVARYISRGEEKQLGKTIRE
jgi:hypothetical protein